MSSYGQGGERRRPPGMKARASGRSQIHQVGRDAYYPGQHSHQHDHEYYPDPLRSVFQGKGPGRLLAAVGFAVTIFAFAGWASIIFRGFGANSSSADALGKTLPSGVHLGVAYFLLAIAGGVLSAVGSSMARSAARQGGVIAHSVIAVALVLASTLGLFRLLDGAPVSVLVPSFSAAPSSGTLGLNSGSTVVSDRVTSSGKDGVTMSVTQVEDQSDNSSVRLRIANDTGDTLAFYPHDFQLTDARGVAYSASDMDSWQVGPGAVQAFTVHLDRRIDLGHGPLRVEFTNVYGSLAMDSIAVTGVPSR